MTNNRYVKRNSSNKYNAKLTKFNGRVYHSALEAHYASELYFRQKAGEILEIVPQYKISIDIQGKHICNYFMDFKVVLKDGTIEMHEVKGKETDLWIIKWRLAIVLYPEWKFILIK